MAVSHPHQAQTEPYRFITCPRYKRNMMRMGPSGISVMCKSCDEPHVYTWDELNAIRDQLEREQAQSNNTEQKH